jgi:hypothetical protein
VPFTGEKKSSGKKKISDIVAIDLATSGVKLVRAKRSKDGAVIVGVDVLAPIDLSPETSEEEKKGGGGKRLPLPKAWVSYYAAVCLTGEKAAVRYVSLPGQFKEGVKVLEQLREHMGLDGEYRIAYVITEQPQKKAETRLLAAALPEEDAGALLANMSTGYPAALSIEVSSLSALNAFYMSGVLEQQDGAVGFIDSGARVSLLAVFNKGALVLVRKFNIGGESLIKRLQQQMAVDREVANGIISDGSFDISQSVQGVMEPFLRQISISKDFVERREDCHIQALYVTGGMSLSQYWMDRIQRTAGVETRQWNPFDGLRMTDDALPEKLEGQEARFAAAVGAAMGAFKEI